MSDSVAAMPTPDQFSPEHPNRAAPVDGNLPDAGNQGTRRLIAPSLRQSGLRLPLFLFLSWSLAGANELAHWFKANPNWHPAGDVTATAEPHVVPGPPHDILVTNAGPGTHPQLRTNLSFADVIVSFDYLIGPGAHASVFLASAYRIQLDGPAAGTIGPFAHPAENGPHGEFVTPASAVAGTPGKWHRFEARLRAARYNEASIKVQNALLIEAKLDGTVIHANTLLSGWCTGTETEWETSGGQLAFLASDGLLAIRNFSALRADFDALTLPEASGGSTNTAELVDLVREGAELFKGLGCIECHATQSGDLSQKTGPNLFGLFQASPRDREIEAGEGHRFTVKADPAYLLRSLRAPYEELAIAETGPTAGKAYLPAMPPILREVASDAQVDAIGAYLLTLNEPAHQGPAVKLAKENERQNYDPLTDRLQWLVDRTVRIQRGPMPGMSGRSIHVGLPNGINYTFDPRRLAVVQLWQGGFLDMTGELTNRGGGGLKPGFESREIKLGASGTLLAPLNAAGEPIDFSFVSPVFRDLATARASLDDPRDLPAKLAEVDAQFLGYERDSRDPGAAPAFNYRVGRNTVSLRTEFADDGAVRFVLAGELAATQSFTVNTAVLGTVSVSIGRIENDRWILPAGSLRDATLSGRITLAPKAWRPGPSEFAFARQPLATVPATVEVPRGYTVESYLAPKDNYGRDMLFEALGMDLAPDGTIVVATRTAGIWRLVKGEWQLFAEGLFDSLGVKVEDERGLVVVAGQKAELTRIRDVNGDGLADRYETIADAFTYTGNYHAYLHGPVRDSHGDYYFLLNQNHPGEDDGEYKAGGKYMGTSGGYRGWAIRVPAQGGFEPYADGLRSPASLGVAPDGRLWYADNQGEFMATSKLFVLREGAFYGNPVGLVDRPGMTPASPEIIWEKVKGTRERPVLLMPQSRLANSPGNPAWDTTGGRFGPFGGQMFLGDQTQSNLMRVTTERVGAHEQGSAIVFGTKFASGIMRPLFLTDGSLLLGQTGRGWQAKGGNVTALQRVRWDGTTVAPALHGVSAASDGFNLTFTVPVPADCDAARLASALAIKSWVYRDAPDYGSPELDERPEAVATVRLDADRKVLHVALATLDQPEVHPDQTARVYQITVDGESLWKESGPDLEAFYTLYEFPKP